MLAHLLYGYRAEGLEHVPRTGAFLLAANHKSYVDPPLIGACLPREIRYFAKKELFSVPVLGPMIRHFGAVPVDRAAFDRRAIETALHALRNGHGLLVFPEGTRIRRPGLAAPREGIGMLAARTGLPVIPARISGSWEPRRRLWRRIPIVVRFGPPLALATTALAPRPAAAPASSPTGGTAAGSARGGASTGADPATPEQNRAGLPGTARQRYGEIAAEVMKAIGSLGAGHAAAGDGRKTDWGNTARG